jgi:hypothetical protein
MMTLAAIAILALIYFAAATVGDMIGFALKVRTEARAETRASVRRGR